jgi:hypothetical protein
MLDFKELSTNGNELELLIREILLVKGLKVHWSGIGADGGRDLICYEERTSEFFNDKKTWLIQCKHKAHAGNSVGVADLDDIIDSVTQHKANAYLLVCSTYPSSAVINRLEGITKNETINIEATYWDATIIEQKLSTPELWKIAQNFFPKSSKNATWQIYATENPNHWIVNFRGYHFHLNNRIGSKGNYHFESINNRINDIEKIELKEGHFIRIRAVYFDDKNGNYKWYLDYMYPHNDTPIISSFKISNLLGDGYALEDGQFYSFDVISRPYFPHSDHYDKDHYDYYIPYINCFRIGSEREIEFEGRKQMFIEWNEYVKEEKEKRNDNYNEFVNKLKTIDSFKLLRSVNSNIEDIDKFVKLRDWRELTDSLEIETDHFFSSWFLFDVGNNEKEFIKFISYFPQRIETWFRLTKVYVYTPKENEKTSEYDESENSMFELSIRIHPAIIHTSSNGRKCLNEYFKDCLIAIDEYLKQGTNR